MAKRLIVKGSASVILELFIRDSSSLTGAGLTGLAYNSAGLTCYYHRNKDGAAVQVNLVTMTAGTFTSSGFKEVDAANMPGVYQLCLPDAAYATGSNSVSCLLKGATNMMPVALEIELTVFDVQTAVAQTGDSYPIVNHANYGNAQLVRSTTPANTLDVSATGEAGLDFNNIKDAGGGHTLANIRVPNVTLVDTITTYTGDTPQTGDGYTGITTLLGRLSAARAGYLDTLNGLVASIWAAVVDSPGVTTLMARIASVLTITAGKVDVNDKSGFSLAASQRVKLDAAQPDFVPAIAGDAMTLTSGERTAIANEVEAQIIDETDSEKVLTAITNKIASVNPSLGSLTLAAIAAQVRIELATELARIDASISSRSTYGGTDTAGITTLLARLSSSRAALLDYLDVAISSRLAASGYTAPLDAAGIRTAIGMAVANLDTQLDALPTNGELAYALAAADDATLAQLQLIRNKTDLLPPDPASNTQVNTRLATADYVTGGGDGFTEDDRQDLIAIKGRTSLITTSNVTITSNVTKPGNVLALRRGTTWRIVLTNLGLLQDRSNLYFSLKRNAASDSDNDSLCQISENDGLVRLNKAAATSASDGEILVTDAAAGDITITLKAGSSKLIAPSSELDWDIKIVSPTEVNERVAGKAKVTADVTRKIA